jgi:photosystem II stability/assembly factor-like uncharacterized protein
VKTNYTKVAYCTILLFLVNITIFSQDNWSWLNPKPMGYTINASSNVPSSASIIIAGEKGVVAKSTNYGSSWELLRWDSTQTLKSVNFVTSSVGYACGDNSVILKTTDGGSTWATLPPPLEGISYTQIQFISESTGFLLDKIHSILYKTINGGASWTSTHSDGSVGFFNSFQMIDEDDGWIATGNGTIIKITGGIISSTIVTTSPGFDIIRFFGINNGVALKSGEAKYSTNAGLTWITASSSFGFSASFAQHSSSQKITAVGTGESIAISTDAGNNWTTQATPHLKNLMAISFADELNGLIIGDLGTQYKTIDGGATWDPASSFVTDQQLNSVVFTDENTGYAAGYSGKILKTTDGGANWSLQTSGITETIFKLCFTSSTTGYGVSTSKLLKTTNGTDWTNSSLSYTFQDIHFKDANNWIGCGTSTNKLARTTDGGKNWNTIPMPLAEQKLYALACLSDAQTVLCVGASGKLIRSTNYGGIWTNITSGTSNQLNSVFFSNLLLGWACGNNGTIIRTTDGGLTWSTQTSGTTANLQSIKFYDGSSGISVGHNGVMLWTNDGGATWSQYQTIAPFYLNEVAVLSSTTAVVVGSGGTILRGTNLPLPVELVSFTASVRNNTVNLNWETATEVDNYGFEIERKDKNSTWTKIGFIEGHSTSNSPKYYSFSDNPTGSSKYSYRLKQIDNDGKFEYSGIVEVDLSGMLPKDIEIKNFPNPFNPETNINIKLPETAETTVELYNSTGEKIFTIYKGKLDVGTTLSLKVDGSNLPSGVYLINVSAGKYRKTHKILLMK